MRIFFVAQYGPSGASSRTRVFDYLPLLRAGGVSCDVTVVIPERLQKLSREGLWGRLVYYIGSWLRTLGVGWQCLGAVRRYDVVFVQKVLFTFPFPALLRPFRHKVIFDFDDAIFTLEDPRASLLMRMRTRRRQRGLPAMLRSAHHAIVENAYTADYARRFCPAVSRITGPIDTDRYAPGSVEKSDVLVLGWIGSPTTTRYLELIRDPLVELGRRYKHLRLCVIGASDFEPPGIPVRRLAWSLETEVAHLRTFDIGLMPLPDDPFTRGKGGYKLLQYMAMGLPVVASPVEINREIVTHGVNGLLAETADEWTACLDRLICDDALRRELGAQGRRDVAARYSLRGSAQQLLEILHRVGQTR